LSISVLSAASGRTPVTADLPREGERIILPDASGLLLCGGERRRSIATLNLYDL